jgi:flagellin
MSLFINTNINSLNAQRNLTKSQDSVSTALQRLSSGLRINSAKDDAAGLAIATRFSTQINGLDQAVRNANDGVSLSQTTGSALSEVTNNLQRIRTLAVESTNATNSASDRAALDQEVQQRISEVSRIATQTTFNGLKVLDGSFGQATFQVGANVGDTININLSTGVSADQIGGIATTGAVDTSGGFKSADVDATPGSVESADLSGSTDFKVTTTPDTAASVESTEISSLNFDDQNGGTPASFKVDGKSVSLTTKYSDMDSLASDVQSDLGSNYKVSADGNKLKIETVATGASAAIETSDATGIDFGTPVAGTDGTSSGQNASFKVNGTEVTLDQDYANVDALAADVGTQLGADYSVSNDGGKLKIETADAGASKTVAITDSQNISFGTPVDGTGESGGSTQDLTLGDGDLSIQVGDGKAVDITGTFSDVDGLNAAINKAGIAGLSSYVDSKDQLHLSSAEALTVPGNKASDLGFSGDAYDVSGDLTGADVNTVADANDTISRIDAALQSVSGLDSKLGAIQNRFESTISNLQAVSQNLSSARSRIQDADFAAETASLTRGQILQNAGISVLSQANSAPQSVLKLLQ